MIYQVPHKPPKKNEYHQIAFNLNIYVNWYNISKFSSGHDTTTAVLRAEFENDSPNEARFDKQNLGELVLRNISWYVCLIKRISANAIQIEI